MSISKIFKIISIIFFILSLICIMTIYIYAEDTPNTDPPDINRAMYVYLYSIDNNQVLYEKNADHKIYPASFTKLMTSIIVFEHYGNNTSKKITVTEEMLKGVSGNNIALQVGEIVTADQMINSMIVGGSNDAAQVLAIDVAGSIDAFVEVMNVKSKNIGTIYTVFTNPTGLHDEKMYTTMDDMAKIALYAYKLNRFNEISSQATYEMEETNMSRARRITNRNNYVSYYLTYQYYNPEAIGLNAGSTTTAGHCLATVVNHDGLTYLCLISGASSDDLYIYSYVEANKILKWVYDNWGYVTVVKPTTAICQIPVRLSSKSDYVTLHPQYEVELFLPSDADIEKDVEQVVTVFEEMLTAPVTSGLECGSLGLYYKGKLISTVPLITKNYIDKSNWMYIVDFAENTIHERWFQTSAITFVILFIAYVLLNAKIRYDRIQKRNKKKRKKVI